MQYKQIGQSVFTGSASFSEDGQSLIQQVRVNIGVVGDTYGKANWWDDVLVTGIPITTSIADANMAIQAFVTNYISTAYPDT